MLCNKKLLPNNVASLGVGIYPFTLAAIAQVCTNSFFSNISFKKASLCPEMQVGALTYIYNTLILMFQVIIHLCLIQKSIYFCKFMMYDSWWPYWHLKPNHAANIYPYTRVAEYWAPK